MLDWHTIQGAAASTGAKIVIRLPSPSKRNETTYFYEIANTEGNRAGTKRLVLPPARNNPNRQSVEALFKRFLSKDTSGEYGNSALYNYLKTQNWGSFWVDTCQSKLVQYYPVPVEIHRNVRFPIEWKTPAKFPFDKVLISTHEYSVWINKPPIQPPPSKLGFTFTPVVTPPREHRFGNTSGSGSQLSPTQPHTNRTHISETLTDSQSSPNSGSPIPPGQRIPHNDRPTSLHFEVAEDTPSTSTPLYFLEPADTIRRPPTAMAARSSEFRDWLAKKNPDLDSSQHPCPATRRSETDSADTQGGLQWSRQRTLQLGKIDAHLNNLEHAFQRNQSRLEDGRPHIMLMGTKIQSPYPSEVLTDELLKEFNEIAYRCSVKLSRAMMKKQLECITKLSKERVELLTDWAPTESELLEAKEVEKARTAKRSTYKYTETTTTRQTYVKKSSAYGPAFYPAPSGTGPQGQSQETDPPEDNRARPTRTRTNPPRRDDSRPPNRASERPSRRNFHSEERRAPPGRGQPNRPRHGYHQQQQQPPN